MIAPVSCRQCGGPLANENNDGSLHHACREAWHAANPSPRSFRAIAADTSRSPTVPELFRAMAATYEDRSKTYGGNYKEFGKVMLALFPGGMAMIAEEDFKRWHLFEQIVVKLTRFANSRLTHVDSIHDAAVYAAMLEEVLLDKTNDEK